MPRVLLIVDDRPDVRQAYSRYFKRFFDKVYLAADPAQAETFFVESPAPTALICDYWLGENVPVGPTLIPKWRSRCPSIERVALVSGSEVREVQRTAGVDAVFEKPVDLVKLRGFLLEQNEPTTQP